MPSNSGALGEALPLLAAPRLGGRRASTPGPARRRSGSARGPGRCSASARSSVERWSLTPKRVSRSTSSPHRSMRIGRVGGRREDVDDRAAPGELAAVLDELLAAVAELRRAGRRARRGRRRRRGGRRSARSSVAPGPSRCSSARTPVTIDGRAALGVAQPPQQLEALAHRLDRRADPLERQRLPGREHGHLAGGQELGEVVGRAGRPSCRSGRRRRAGGGSTARPGRRSTIGRATSTTASRASGSPRARVSAGSSRSSGGRSASRTGRSTLPTAPCGVARSLPLCVAARVARRSAGDDRSGAADPAAAGEWEPWLLDGVPSLHDRIGRHGPPDGSAARRLTGVRGQLSPRSSS